MSARVWIERFVLGLVLGVGAFLRLDHFFSVPRGLLYDEGYNGIDAVKIVAGARPLFLPANYGREALFQYLQAVCVALFGRTDWALRVPGVACGLAALPLAYLVIRRLFGGRVALLSTAWLAVSFWHLLYSRMGLRTIALPVVLAAAFYCLWRGLDEGTKGRRDGVPLGPLRDGGAEGNPSAPPSLSGPKGTPSLRPSVPWWICTGFFLGVSLYTYTPARFAPLVVLAFAGYLALARRDLFRRALPGFALAGVVAFLVFAPEGLYFLRHPGDFVDRAADVSIFNSSLNHGDSVAALLYSAERSLGQFVVVGDAQWDRDIPGRPIFDSFSAVLLGLGLIRLLWSARRSPRAVFVLLWLALLLVPSIVSVRNVPNSLRVTGVIPAIFALPALGADWLWSVFETWRQRMEAARVGKSDPRDRFSQRAPPPSAVATSRKLTYLSVLWLAPYALVGLGVVVGGAATYHDYFDYWARTRSVSETWDADRWTAVDLGKRLAARTASDVFVGGGDPDGPVQTYDLLDDPAAARVHVFDGLRSLIFPTTDGAFTYVFTRRDLPAPPLLHRYFDGPTPAVSATAPDGDTIQSYTLRPGRTTFEPDHPLPARFGDAIQVYGFDYPKDVRAGDPVTVRWYWRIVGPTPRELAFFNQVYDDANLRRGQQDDRTFAPDYWPVGTTGISTFDVPTDPASPTGPAMLVVGVYTRADLVRLPVLDGKGNVAGSQLTLGPIKLHGAAPPAASVPISHPARFADGVDLLGYDVRPTVARPGDVLQLTLDWAARARPAANYTVFVHLLDARGQLVAQADSPPRSGSYPTSLWDAGETIVDEHQLSLPPNLPPGAYRIEVGLYLPSTGQRLSVQDPSSSGSSDSVSLGPIEIQPRYGG